MIQFIENHIILCSVFAVWFLTVLILVYCLIFCKDEIVQDWDTQWKDNFKDWE
jgi:hypothetical protein